MRLTFDVNKFLTDKPLAITEAGLEEMRAHIAARIAVFESAPRDFVETMAAAGTQARNERRAGATGVIPIRGAISQHAKGDLSSFLFGGATTEAIAQDLRAMLDDDEIAKIVLDIDSPGGSSFGVNELASEIYKSRGKKPIIAVANSLAASAAYWIGASADEFWVTPGGLVGSIGVYTMHQDVSKAADEAGIKTTFVKAGKYKTIGNPFAPMSDEELARVQARVDDVYDLFIHDVARGRGVSEATVRGGYGEGDVLTAKKARAEGMVDGIATLEQVMSRAFKTRETTTTTVSSSEPAIVVASVFKVEDLDGDETVDQVDEDDDKETTPTDEEAEGQARLGRMRLRVFQDRAAASSAVI